MVHLEAVIFIVTLLHHVDHFSNGALPFSGTHLFSDEQADLLNKRVFSQQLSFSLQLLLTLVQTLLVSLGQLLACRLFKLDLFLKLGHVEE